MKNILVIDVGTSSMRGVLFDEAGKVIHVVQKKYQTLYTSPILVEEEPAVWRATLLGILKDQAEYTKVNGFQVAALSLTSQRSSIIPVDREGKPLRNAIMWMDKRNTEIAAEMSQYRHEIFKKTGARVNTVFSGTKMTWVHRNEKHIYDAAYKIITIADYLSWLMTGEYRTDHTYASRSLLFNIRKREWDPDMLKLLEVDEDKLCDLIAPGAVHGYTTKDLEAKTGLPAGIPLISAGGDQQCAALGMGVIAQGDMEITTGTGAFLIASADHVPDDLRDDIICGAHAVPGYYALEASMLACASVYDWFNNQFYQEVPRDQRIPAVNAEVEKSPAGAKGTLALPYFQGRGTPDWNSEARGAFLNLTPNASRGDLARTLLESIALEAANSVELLKGYIGGEGDLFINGGLTKFDEFNRIQASAYNCPVRKSSNPEQTSLGAWSSAAVALGIYADHATAIAKAKADDVITEYAPVPEWTGIYKEKRAEMNRIYSLLYKK